MPTTLKKLRVKRVDLVDAGANPDSWVRLYKGRHVGKAATFDEMLMARSVPQVWEQVQGLVTALSDTIASILYDPEMADKAGAIRTALGSFADAVDVEVTAWAESAATAAGTVEKRDKLRAGVVTRLTTVVKGRLRQEARRLLEGAGPYRDAVRTYPVAAEVYRQLVAEGVREPAPVPERAASNEAEQIVVKVRTRAAALVPKDGRLTERAAVAKVFADDPALYSQYVAATAVAVGAR